MVYIQLVAESKKGGRVQDLESASTGARFPISLSQTAGVLEESRIFVLDQMSEPDAPSVSLPPPNQQVALSMIPWALADRFHGQTQYMLSSLLSEGNLHLAVFLPEVV